MKIKDNMKNTRITDNHKNEVWGKKNKKDKKIKLDTKEPFPLLLFS